MNPTPRAPILPETDSLSVRTKSPMRLTREVRIPVRPFAGADWSYELCLRATVSGAMNQDTGFLFDAGLLQRWVIQHAEISPDQTLVDFSPSDWLAGMWARLEANVPAGLHLEEVELRFSSAGSWTIVAGANTEPLLRREFHFCAAHRLHNPHWSDEENRRVFGPCNNAAGHGHNYRLEITVDAHAPVELVEQAVREKVLERFDHRNFNVDVPEMAGINPTVEAITDAIWNALDAALPERLLWSVRLHETPKIAAERRRENG